MLLPLCYINTFDIVFMINKYDVNVYNNIHVSLELCQWHSFDLRLSFKQYLNIKF